VKAYAALGEQGKALEWLHGLLKGNLAPNCSIRRIAPNSK
jgi:hypothetical protein